MRSLIQSLREQRDFAGIREELEKSKHYPAKTGDRYIFPDEKEYKDKITHYLPENVDIQIKIQKSMAGKWKAYSLDHHVDENLH